MPALTRNAARAQAAEELTAVLPLVVRHAPKLSSSPKDVCSLLQASRACRAALQQATGSISVDNTSAFSPGFWAWLPAHAGLVGSIHIYTLPIHPDPAHVQLLHDALRRCGRQPAAAAAGALPPLQLHSYNAATGVDSSAVLSALAVRSLTCLGVDITRAGAPALAQLGAMTWLRELTLWGRPYPSAAFAAAISQLKLTTLHVFNARLSPTVLDALPVSVRTVLLRIGSGSSDNDSGSDSDDNSGKPAGSEPAAEPVFLQLSHLTNLVRLSINLRQGCAGALLPAGLTSLALRSATMVDAPLTGCSQLEQLELEMSASKVTLRTLASLAHLPLRSLRVGADEHLRGELAAAVGACRQIEHLHLSGRGSFAAIDEGLCQSLAPLVNLHGLFFAQLIVRGVHHLTALTALRSLTLYQCGLSAAERAAAIALRTALTGLDLGLPY